MAVIVDQLDPYDLVIWQGKTWELPVRLTVPDPLTPGGRSPVDLSGYTGRGQVRSYAGGPLQADFTVSIDGPTGRIVLTLPPEQTRKIAGKAVYDIELDNGSRVVGLLHGDIKVIPEVTLP